MEDSEVLENNMYRYNICNKEYTRECDYTRHLNNTTYEKEEHINLLNTHWQNKIDLVHNGNVKMLKHYYIKGKSLDYVDIYNSKCNHYSTLTMSSLLNGQDCAHPECVSETKRKAALKLSKDPKYKSKLSKAVKEALKDPVKRMNRLRGQAEVQRNNDSPYEAMFIGVLTKYKINYEYQIPMIIRDIGCIIDFYLPDYETYVNVNSDIFHWMQDDEIHGEFKESAHAVQRKDKLLRKVFREEGLIYKEVYSYDDMLGLIHNLIKEGSDVG